jgi:thiamine pyrophosphate-dependent acetolactate synthase large subunit-like protein
MNVPQPIAPRTVVRGVQRMTPCEAFMDGMDTFAPVGIRLTFVVDEQGGGHMADGCARASRRHGVVLGQNGPGISNAVTVIAAAYRAHSPAVVIPPETGTLMLGLDGLQQAQQLPMFEQFTKYHGHVANSRRMADFNSRCFERAVGMQMTGGRTTVIEIICTRELGDALRRAVLARPVRPLDKYRDHH